MHQSHHYRLSLQATVMTKLLLVDIERQSFVWEGCETRMPKHRAVQIGEATISQRAAVENETGQRSGTRMRHRSRPTPT